MNKTISSVIDDINEWNGPHGTVWFVTAIFTDESVGSVGRKDHDAALEVQGLLREAIGQPQDFVLEPAGQTKTGREKFKIKGFGTPGGAATYTAPGVQGSGTSAAAGTTSSGRAGRSPEHDHYIQERMDRRTALMQAVQCVSYLPYDDKARKNDPGHRSDIDAWADQFYAWLRKTSDNVTTSEPASSAYEGGGTDTVLPVGSPVVQAGAGSETMSPAYDPPGVPGQGNVGGDTQSAAETADGGAEGLGKAICPPHDLDLDVAPKAMRYPCRKCSFWVKPTMAAEEVEEAR